MPRIATLSVVCLGFVLLLAGSADAARRRPPPPLQVTITSPSHGLFTNASSVTVTGTLNRVTAQMSSLTVNGVSVMPFAGTDFSISVPVDPAAVFNPIVVEATPLIGDFVRKRVTVIAGDGVNSGFVADGSLSAEALALRLTDGGLDQFGPIVESLSAGAFDIGPLITGQNPILDDECVVDSIFGCLYFGTVNVVEVGFSSFGLDAHPGASTLDADFIINDFFVELELDIRDLVAVNFTCGLEIEASTVTIGTSFDLSPDAGDPSLANVDLIGAPGVVVSGFESSFISGLCDSAVIGDIIQALVSPSMIEGLVIGGFADNMADPDGAGPLDSPLADAIEGALADISIAGPAGEALGVVLDAPLSAILEDIDGLTLETDAGITSSAPDPAAPDLTASYTVAETLPAFPTTTPVGAVPYHIGIGLSSSMMNQLLKAQVEGGLLRTDVTEFLVGGSPVPLNLGLLSLFIPEIWDIPGVTGAEPAVIEVRPTLAPVFTGNAGPDSELAELLIGGLSVEILAPTLSAQVARLELDLQVGVDLTIAAGALNFTLGEIPISQVEIDLLDNPLGANEGVLVGAFESVLPLITPLLGDALGEFPVPEFLGMQLSPLEVGRMPGGFLGLFADLVTVPTSSLANLAVVDQSSGDSSTGSGCWIDEWRHRVADLSSASSISANLRGMLGSDAGCTTNDHSRNATAAYQVDFDVVGVAGEEWTLQIDQSILGAMTLISDGYNDGFGFQDGGGDASFSTPVQASWSIAGGSSGNIDFSIGTSVSDGIGGSSSTINQQFSGSNGTSIVGTGNASVTVNVSFGLHTFSNSNTAFPTANGDELAIRFGKGDTIGNFDAGSYPGEGSRNIANDGHFLDITLTSVPIP